MRHLVALAALGAVLTVTDVGGARSDGFVLWIASAEDAGTLDPALAATHVSIPLVAATCSTLYGFGRRARTPRPEVATAYPRVSADGRTHTITVRRGLRFSDGRAITAASYARAIARVRSHATRSPWAALTADVVRVRARGDALRIRLRRPVGDLVSRLASTWSCPVPPDLPVDPLGIDLMPASGPYVVRSRTPGREVVLERNAYYRGTRARNAETIVLTVGGTAESNAKEVEEGRADYVQYFWLLPPPPGTLLESLAARHGVNRRQFLVYPALGTVYLALNAERPLFRRNARLRRAVSLALDRPAILREGGALRGRVTDQLLPPGMPGFQQRHVYPLTGPDLETARRLAAGQRRSGRATLFVADDPVTSRRADVIRRNLAAIGLEVDVRSFPRPTLISRVATRGEPFDLVLTGWHAHYSDPAEFVVGLLDGALVPRDNVNLSYFQGASREIEAAHRLPAPERYAALGRLEAEVMERHAPVAPLFHPYSYSLVSARVGCVDPATPGFDYGEICLR